MMSACQSLSVLAPTEVANAFAASFAPMPIDARKAKIPPTITIHRYWSSILRELRHE